MPRERETHCRHFLGTGHIPGRVCSQRPYLWNQRTQLACCVSLNSAEMVTEGVSEIDGNLIVSDRTIELMALFPHALQCSGRQTLFLHTAQRVKSLSAMDIKLS